MSPEHPSIPEESASLADAIAGMQAVKAEHREILARIAQDPGMAPETRWELIAHLYEEEDEHLARMAALAGGAAGSAGSAAPSRPGLTVGSLRPRRDHPAPPRGSVGSLRRS